MEGWGVRKFLVGSLALGLWSGAQGHWEQVFPISGLRDTLWKDTAGPDTPRGGYRFAREAQGIEGPIYLANGKSLLYTNRLFNPVWKVFTPSSSRQSYPFQEPAPLAAAANGESLVLWGNWRSRNHGMTWEPLPFPSARFLVYAIGEGGVCLGGGREETIERSLDSGRTWRQVYLGRSTGYVRHLLLGDSGWAFAALAPDGFLFSRDNGATWNPVPDAGPKPPRVLAMAFLRWPRGRADQPPKPVLWSLRTDSRSGKVRPVRTFLESGRTDTLSSGLPDTTFSCLSADWNSVFVGAGQSLWMSLDNGDRWTSEDLDLRKEVSEVHAGHYPFVLTPKELFFHYHETGIGPGKSLSGLRRSSRTASPLLFMRSGDIAIRHLIDGRQVRMASDPGIPFLGIPDAP
jgi:hypothetical protein